MHNLSEIHKKYLCLSEKVSVICAHPDTLLKRITKQIAKCRHRNKFLLANIKK